MRFEIARYGYAITKGVGIGSGMVSDILGMCHRPLALLGLLPFPDGLGCIYVNVIHITHAEGMESYGRHNDIITSVSGSSDRIGQTGKGPAPVLVPYFIQGRGDR